ncbi:hypothetical protein Dvar_02810 [Desulfosarcina variabilis str. Montpellier]|uniref:hypothetical protein n=1 Tax=Desulfosarcina variabilis TaxID=2300 RepID=UPI003AFA6CD5
MDTPVLYIVFNRPSCVRKVLRKIKEAKPTELFVAADGPRNAVPKDDENCEKVRDLVSTVDWKCHTEKLFRNENVGCAEAIGGAISWFFENVDQGIIIEEDCLPDTSFFKYSEFLLKKYRKNERIMHIAGTNLLPFPNAQHSYSFSRVVQVGASATWKRAWSCYDKTLCNWPTVKTRLDQDIYGRYTQRFFRAIEVAYSNPGRAYGPIWAYSCLANNGLSIVPKVNLIKNIGFGKGATHTKNKKDIQAKIKAMHLSLPLESPSIIEADKKYDEDYIDVIYSQNLRKRRNTSFHIKETLFKIKTKIEAIRLNKGQTEGAEINRHRRMGGNHP